MKTRDLVLRVSFIMVLTVLGIVIANKFGW